MVREPQLPESAAVVQVTTGGDDNGRTRCAASWDPFRFVLIAVAGWINQRQLEVIDCLREENCVLREQLGQRRLRLNDDQRRRLAAKSKGLGRKLLAEVATIVTPERLLAWHRKLIAKKIRPRRPAGTRKASHPQRGRGAGGSNAEENRDRGYRRIQCALSNLGHNIGRSTIAAVLQRHGIEPVPERSRKTTWKEFQRENRREAPRHRGGVSPRRTLLQFPTQIPRGCNTRQNTRREFF
jgi:hypothetical protein